jgi:hypothetical protein
MNLGTISVVLTCVASFMAILTYLYKGVNRGVQYNKARTLAQQGRITSVVSIVELQGLRIGNIEKHLSLPVQERGRFQPSDELLNLENKAMDDYENHHTNLTGL